MSTRGCRGMRSSMREGSNVQASRALRLLCGSGRAPSLADEPNAPQLGAEARAMGLPKCRHESEWFITDNRDNTDFTDSDSCGGGDCEAGPGQRVTDRDSSPNPTPFLPVSSVRSVRSVVLLDSSDQRFPASCCSTPVTSAVSFGSAAFAIAMMSATFAG